MMAIDTGGSTRLEEKGASGTNASVKGLTPIQEHFEVANALSQFEK